MLIRLSIDVYNDSLLLTPTAFSWPGRSLASLHSDQLISSFRENGFDQQFEEFKPPGSVLHYRDPVIYAELLKIERELQSKVTSNLVNAAVVWAIQVDGSLSRTMIDNKFVRARIIDKDLNMKTVFLSVDAPQARGAEGLLEIVKAIINSFGLDKSKLVGVTTEGESANTGRRNGFWKLLRTYLDRDIFSFWCVANRSDLAVEDMEHAVPELQLWKANVLGVASYFRTSKNHKATLLTLFPDAHVFPAYFEVRFAEHLVNVVEAVLHNRDRCIEVRKQISAEGTRHEKAEASGFLHKWTTESNQVWLTALMGDVAKVFKNLQKNFQSDDFILTDVITCRDTAIRKLDLMSNAPYPGGCVEKYLEDEKRAMQESENDDEVEPTPSCTRFNAFVSFLRSREAIRVEVVMAAKNYMT